MNRVMRILSAVCWGLYLTAFLFLPVLSFPVGRAFSGAELFSYTVWVILPLISGTAALILTLTVPRIVSAVIGFVSAVIPVTAFYLIRYEIQSGSLYISGSDYGLFQMGYGAVLAVLFGLGGAVLCLLSVLLQPKPKVHTAGLTSDDGDEW